jgi:hypothetical protein
LGNISGIILEDLVKTTKMLTQIKCKILKIIITYFFVAELFGFLGCSSDQRVFGVTIWYCKQNHW